MDELPVLGFGLPVSGAWASPDNMIRIASRAEALGLASLWTFQRTLHPVGSGLGPAQLSVHDSVAALAYVAGHTDRIGLGTATMCAPFTAPVLLAKAMASLDVLSGGRLTVGLGMGWLPEEHVAVGVPMTRRAERFEEYLRCLRTLWTDDPVQFDGEFYTVPRSHVGPAVAQQPHPPVLLGGTAEAALRRAGRLAQGWIGGSDSDLSRIGERVDLVRRGALDAGRDPTTLRILVRVVDDLGDGVRLSTGARDQVRAALARLGARGVTEVCVDPNLDPAVGGLGVDPIAARRRAERALDTVVGAMQ